MSPRRLTSMPPLLALLAVMTLSCLAFPARADSDDNASASPTNHVKRPIEDLFKTDVVFPQEKGEFEVEVASVYQNHAGGDTWTIPLGFEYGLSDQWQVEGEWDSLVQRYPKNESAVRGTGDVSAGTQYSFINIGHSSFHVAPRLSIEGPVGDVNRGLSEGFVEYEPAVILARDFRELHRTQFFTEIGATFVQRVLTPRAGVDADPPAHSLNLGSGFFVLFPHAAATLEFNWNNNQWNHHGTENDLYLTPGCLWRVRRNTEIGLGIPFGLNNASDRFEVVAHVVWEFESRLALSDE